MTGRCALVRREVMVKLTMGDLPNGRVPCPRPGVVPWRATLAATLCALCVMGLGASDAHAQAGAAVVMPRCTVLLPPDTVRAVAGNGFTAQPQRQREEHVTDCAWAKGDSATITLQWFDRAAIQSSSVTRTLEGYADMLLTAGEEVAGKKRDAVTGMGGRAATVQGSTQVMLVVQRPDGVVRALAGGLTNKQILALAKALSGNA